MGVHRPSHLASDAIDHEKPLATLTGRERRCKFQPANPRRRLAELLPSGFEEIRRLEAGAAKL